MPSWLSIFAVFNHFSIPLILTLLFFAYIFLFFAFTAFEKNPLNFRTTGTVAFQILLGVCFPQLTTTRYFIISCSLCSMVINILYTSAYTSFMITPRRTSQVETFCDLIALNFRLTGEQAASYLLESRKVTIPSNFIYLY